MLQLKVSGFEIGEGYCCGCCCTLGCDMKNPQPSCPFVPPYTGAESSQLALNCTPHKESKVFFGSLHQPCFTLFLLLGHSHKVPTITMKFYNLDFTFSLYLNLDLCFGGTGNAVPMLQS
eukprot:TRINITY_DN67073_c7_g1_i2.p2 TRINITY_DN67073_c7_g1~~TRINITY_DN67073_c7_g1_i2.p2  ORF type:complete len:119 (+),score=2.74 TRINITY_DN67073_c7_g1_i2:147-503(+)